MTTLHPTSTPQQPEKQNLDCTPQIGGMPPLIDNCPPPTPPHEKIEAEKLFDSTVYGGISYGAQATTSILLSKWITYGGGKPIFDKMATWLGDNIVTRIRPNIRGAAAAQKANTALIASIMVMVGNSFVAPVKWIEDNKPSIVAKIDSWLTRRREAQGNPLSEEEKAQHQAALDAIAAAPRQSWASLLEARGAALATVYAVLFAIGEDRNAWAQNKSAELVSGAAKNLGFNKLAKSEALKQYAGLTFVDAFYSAVAAGGLYAWCHYVRPPKDESKDPHTETGYIAGALENQLHFQDRVKPVEKTAPVAYASHRERIKAVQDESQPNLAI